MLASRSRAVEVYSSAIRGRISHRLRRSLEFQFLTGPRGFVRCLAPLCSVTFVLLKGDRNVEVFSSHGDWVLSHVVRRRHGPVAYHGSERAKYLPFIRKCRRRHRRAPGTIYGAIELFPRWLQGNPAVARRGQPVLWNRRLGLEIYHR